MMKIIVRVRPRWAGCHRYQQVAFILSVQLQLGSDAVVKKWTSLITEHDSVKEE